MKKLYWLLLTLLLPLNVFGQSSFPLDIGNKWYYMAGSTEPDFYYKVVKGITDTLYNGFKEVTSNYFYQDRIIIKKEYWAYINGKFYVNSLPDLNTASIYFDAFLIRDTCISSMTLSSTCRYLKEFKIFNISGIGQEYKINLRSKIEVENNNISIFPDIGIIQIKNSGIKSGGLQWKDSTQLVGILKNGIVFGDTTITFPFVTISHQIFPLNNSTGIPTTVILKWEGIQAATCYRLQISRDSIFINVINDFSNLRDTIISIDSLQFSAPYYWRVQTIIDEQKTWSEVWKFTTVSKPADFNLYQNFPNPFNFTTKIKYDLPKSGHITLKIFDLLGREVAVIVNEEKLPGQYEVKFLVADGSSLASGVYLYMIEAGGYVETKKLILMK